LNIDISQSIKPTKAMETKKPPSGAHPKPTESSKVDKRQKEKEKKIVHKAWHSETRVRANRTKHRTK
jgi:hypothetical protein